MLRRDFKKAKLSKEKKRWADKSIETQRLKFPIGSLIKINLYYLFVSDRTTRGKIKICLKFFKVCENLIFC